MIHVLLGYNISMQTLIDFLTFKHFIAADILILCYYIGAIIIPILLYKGRRYLIDNVQIIRSLNDLFLQTFSSLDTKNRRYARLFFLLMFFAMELMWRMMFEMMIGYFQMHDYLQQIRLH